jgi:hypothetical protein
MKTYFLDFIPSIIRSSKRLDDLTMIKNHHWVLIDTETSDKTVLIFLAGNRLKIVRNGISKNSTWEILENAYLDIDLIDVSLLVKYVFVDEDFLMLKVDSREEFFVFINETKFGKELNSIDQIRSVLKVKYPWGKIEKYHLLFSLVQKSYTYKMGHFSEYSVKFNDQVVSSVYFSTSKNCWFIYEKSGDILTFKSKGSFLNYLLP